MLAIDSCYRTVTIAKAKKLAKGCLPAPGYEKLVTDGGERRWLARWGDNWILRDSSPWDGSESVRLSLRS